MTLAQHLNPFFTRRVSLETALTPTQCAERLGADVAPVLRFWPGAQQLRGRVDEAGFRVHRFRAWHRSLPVEARGRFRQGAGGGRGTRLELVLGWRREDAIGTGLGLAAGTAALVLAAFSPDAPPAWTPWLFAAIVVVALTLAGWTTLGEDAWLLGRISTMLEAAEVTAIS